MTAPTDVMLARFERLALLLAAAAVGVALVAPGGGVRMASSVAGGALLSGASYWAIKRGVAGLASAMMSGSTLRTPRGFLAFIARYALLAGMAYVMIARLRLHPIGLLGGASVIPLAAAIAAFSRRP
jgi:hypothetical protein